MSADLFVWQGEWMGWMVGDTLRLYYPQWYSENLRA